MKHINSFEKHNESWRQTKAYLRLPALLIDTIMSKVLNYIPKLNMTYDSMAAKIDTDTSFNSGYGNTIKDNIEKINLSDIKDSKVRKSLILSGLLKDWNIYKLDRENQGKTPIYISKDELKKGDPIHGLRISQDADTEFYVIAAKHSSEHEEMRAERSSRNAKKRYNELKSKLTKSISRKGTHLFDHIMTRTSMGNFTPLFHTLIKEGYLDLVKIAFESISNDYGKRLVLVHKYDSDGDYTVSDKGESALNLKTTDEVKSFLDKSIYDLWLRKNNNNDETEKN